MKQNAYRGSELVQFHKSCCASRPGAQEVVAAAAAPDTRRPYRASTISCNPVTGRHSLYANTACEKKRLLVSATFSAQLFWADEAIV